MRYCENLSKEIFANGFYDVRSKSLFYHYAGRQLRTVGTSSDNGPLRSGNIEVRLKDIVFNIERKHDQQEFNPLRPCMARPLFPFFFVVAELKMWSSYARL